jgi:hypothetical protein
VDDGDLVVDKNGNISNHLQAIANTAGFHFAFIEQGGSSLYPALAQKVTNLEVLRVLLGIGGSEIMHFQTWHDKAGNANNITEAIFLFRISIWVSIRTILVAPARRLRTSSRPT